MTPFSRKHRVLAVALLIALAQTVRLERALAIQSSSAPADGLAVTSEPEVIVNGSPCLFRVKSQKPLRSLGGKWQGRDVFFNFDERDGTWYGFAGVDTETARGQQQLTLEATTTNGARFTHTHPVRIERANYPTVHLSVPRQYTEPDADTLARIKEEQEVKKEAFARLTASRLWSGNFVAPIGSAFTNEFGVRRTFNRKVQSVHQGL